MGRQRHHHFMQPQQMQQHQLPFEVHQYRIFLLLILHFLTNFTSFFIHHLQLILDRYPPQTVQSVAPQSDATTSLQDREERSRSRGFSPFPVYGPFSVNGPLLPRNASRPGMVWDQVIIKFIDIRIY
jgi:hypothetical protein